MEVAKATVVSWHPAITTASAFVFSSFLVIPFCCVSSSLPTHEIRSRRAQIPHFQPTRNLVRRDLPAARPILGSQPKESPSENLINGMNAAQAVSHRAKLCSEEETQYPRVFVVVLQTVERFPKCKICDDIQSRVSLVFCHVDFAFSALSNLPAEPCNLKIGVGVND